MEYIVKILILIVVVAVVIALILKFSDEIKTAIKSLFKPKIPEKNFPQLVEKNDFSSGEISVYIEDCYSTMISFPEDEQNDVICYILQPSNGFNIRKEDLISKLPDELKNKVNIKTNFQKDVVKIEYIDIGNTILVRD